MTWRCPGSDTAVSEVVGYVLVTGITVVAITLVMLTSGPALDRIQADQQHDAMLGYYHDLDQAFSEILSGSPAGSTPVWRVGMGSGSLALDNGPGHMWAYAVDEHEDKRLFYGGFDDGDNTFTVVRAGGSGSVTGLSAEAWSWDGTQKEEITVGVDGSDPWTITLTGEDLESNTVEVRFSDDDADEFSRVWFVDAGTVEWTNRGSDRTQLLYQNTGIISARDGGQVLHNQPRIPAPQVIEEDPKTENIFVRIAQIEGTASVGGQTQATVLVASDGNHVRHSTTQAERVQLYPPTSTTTAWERYLTNDVRGFDYTWDQAPGGEDIPVAYKDTDGADDELHVTMLQTEVTMALRGGV